MFTIKDTFIEGCYEIQPRIIDDTRGRFVKVFDNDIFNNKKLETNFVEEYYSCSIHRVIRGLHFQIPPKEHVKMVFCVSGEVLDVVLDIRIGSPTYGKVATFCLSSAKANSIYIPKGLAHGFYVKSDKAILVYKVSTTYSPDYDSGILWSSIDVDWPTKFPILSERDQKFQPFSNFSSPFIFDEK